MIREAEGAAISSYDAKDSFFDFIVAYQGKNAYHLKPLYQRILDKWPECKVAVGIEAKDYWNIYNSYRTAKAAMNCAFYQAPGRRDSGQDGHWSGCGERCPWPPPILSMHCRWGAAA